MDEFNDKTLTEDIRALAKGLLDDPLTGPIFADAGIHRDFSDEEMEAIKERCGKEPFIAAYDMSIGPEVHSYFRNMWTAIAVARRVGEGDFRGVDDTAATTMIEANKNVLHDPETGKYFEQEKYGQQNFDRVITYAEFLPLLKEFVAKPDLPGMIDHWLSIYEQNGRDRLDRNVSEAWAPIAVAANLLLFRYGFIQRAPLDVVGKDVILEGINLNHEQAARDVSARYGRVDFGGED